MLLTKANLIRYAIVVETNNPYYEACKKFNETKRGATDVVEAIRWEFEQAEQLQLFNKMVDYDSFSFRLEKEFSFGGLGYIVEYATRATHL